MKALSIDNGKTFTTVDKLTEKEVDEALTRLCRLSDENAFPRLHRFCLEGRAKEWLTEYVEECGANVII